MLQLLQSLAVISFHKTEELLCWCFASTIVCVYPVPAFTFKIRRLVCQKWLCATSKVLEISYRLLSSDQRDGGLGDKCHPWFWWPRVGQQRAAPFFMRVSLKRSLRLQTLGCSARASGPDLWHLDTSMMSTCWGAFKAASWTTVYIPELCRHPQAGKQFCNSSHVNHLLKAI